MRRTVSTTEESQSAARAVIQAPRRNCRTRFVSSLAVLCNVVIGSITILPTSAAADELPKPKTAYCIGDQAHPGNFGCAEAGWTAGAIHRNLGVPQERLVGSDPEQRMVMSTLVKMERYYDEEVPLMPKDVQDTCINRDSLCAYWASLGDCDTNRQYMIDTCPAACQLCWLAGTDLI